MQSVTINTSPMSRRYLTICGMNHDTSNARVTPPMPSRVVTSRSSPDHIASSALLSIFITWGWTPSLLRQGGWISASSSLTRATMNHPAGPFAIAGNGVCLSFSQVERTDFALTSSWRLAMRFRSSASIARSWPTP